VEGGIILIIVACQVCGDTKILRGHPDKDGFVRTCWMCKKCGTGQTLQLPVSSDVRQTDLRKIILGLPEEFTSNMGM